MGELEPVEPWRQRFDESDHEYAWFKRFAELGKHRRSIAKTSAELGVPTRMIRVAARERDWAGRVEAFDNAVVLVSGMVVPNDSEALARQYAIGMAMMDLGIEAVRLKNPALIKTKEAMAMLQEGAEMARRGAGVADLTIEQRNTQERVERQFLDLLPDPEPE